MTQKKTRRRSNLPDDVIIIGNKDFRIYLATVLMRLMDDGINSVFCISNYRNTSKLERLIKILSFYGIKEDDRITKKKNGFYQMKIELRY